MHPITSLLSTLLLSTTLTSALPATDPPRNIANANQPQHSTPTTTDPVSAPGAHVRRQKVAQPHVLIAPDRKPGWKRSSEPEPDLAARQVKWVPPHRNYLPVPDKAFKARDVGVNDDWGVERRQKVAQPWVPVVPDRKKGDWKRSEEPVGPEENGDSPGVVVARQMQKPVPVHHVGPASGRTWFKARDVGAGEEPVELAEDGDSPGVIARQMQKPVPVHHVGQASGRTWFKARDVGAGEEPVAPVENDSSPGIVARQIKKPLPVTHVGPASGRTWFKARDVEAGEEAGDGNRKRDKGSYYVSAGANIGANLKPWESSEKLQMYW